MRRFARRSSRTPLRGRATPVTGPVTGALTGALTAALALALAPSALAGPAAEVTSLGDEPGAALLRLAVDYGYESERAELAREDAGPASSPQGPIALRDDLDATRVRHTVTPRLELAFAPRLWLALALPYVLADRRELALHDGVDRASSSTLASGFLPAAGFDADHDGAGFADGEALVLRGPSRRGLDQLWIALGATLMNQRSDPSKPTWKLGVEGGLAIGKVARFDSTRPGANDAVGRGVHEIHVWTSMAKRVSFVEPYLVLSWKAPVATKDASLFRDLGYGTTNVMPPQVAQVRVGAEAIAIERPTSGSRLAVELGGRLAARFEGRDYSEMWEAFALAGNASADDAPLVLDADPSTLDLQALSHPGITNVENHLEMGASLALRAQVRKALTVAVTAELAWRTDHAITFADAGVDLPTCSAGQTSGCETLDNDLVDDGTAEQNPAYSPLIDLVGNRYRSVAGSKLVLGFELRGAF